MKYLAASVREDGVPETKPLTKSFLDALERAIVSAPQTLMLN